jgi:hypothetical protein
MPTGDPGIKPVELLSWAKDFKASTVPYRIPGFDSKDSKSDPSLKFNASNPINCGNVNFDKDIKGYLERNMSSELNAKVKEIAADFYYYNNKTKDLLQQNYGSFETFVDNLYAIIRRESSGNPYARNTKNGNGTWDCGLVQINTQYASYDFNVLLQKYNKPIYDKYKSKVSSALNSGNKAEICRVLTENPELNLAIGISLLAANLDNKKYYGTVVKANLAYGGKRFVDNKRFASDHANCIFAAYLQKYPQFNKNKEFEFKG